MAVELGGPFIAELRRSGRSSAVMAGRCGQGGVRRAVRGEIMALGPLAGVGT